jgi:hypothetical protein
MTESVLICKACYDADRGWWIPEYEERTDGTAVRRCPHCHTITMFYSNQGKLDLALEEQRTEEDSDTSAGH